MEPQDFPEWLWSVSERHRNEVRALVKAARQLVRLCDASEEAGEWTQETDDARETVRAALKPFEQD